MSAARPLSESSAMKPPVLLFHGLTGAPAELQTVSRAVRRAGYEVVTPMLPGHGVDEAALLKTNERDWLAAAEAELERLSANGPVVVGGLSMGAVIALALAQRRPEQVAGLLLFAPTLKYDGFTVPKMAAILPFFAMGPLRFMMRLYRFKERPPYGIKDERLREMIADMMFSGLTQDAGLPFMPGKSLADNMHLVREVERRLAEVTQPALIVHAVEDDVTDVRNARRLAGALRGPVELLLLQDSYHLVTVDRERNKVAKAAVEFLERLWAADARADGAEPARALESAA